MFSSTYVPPIGKGFGMGISLWAWEVVFTGDPTSPACDNIHSIPKLDSYKIFLYTIPLSTSGGNQDVYSILLEALLGNIMTLLVSLLIINGTSNP